MTGIVWGADLTSAIKKLQQIDKQYEAAGVKATMKVQHKRMMEIKYGNGDFWYALKFERKENAMTSNVAYIDEALSSAAQDHIKFINTTEKPWQAVNYYSREQNEI